MARRVAEMWLDVEEAVRRTVLYADIFDWPLTREEIFRYLVSPGGSRQDVDMAIDDCLLPDGGLESDGTYVYLMGREDTVRSRLARTGQSARMWRHCRFYAGLIWRLPYVRMIAVTGSLAMNAATAHDDVDFLIVTTPGRVWLTRGMIVLLCRLARLRGHRLCPNYVLASSSLHLDQRDLYVAHEIAHMAPIHGALMFQHMMAVNAWYRDFLPNVDHGQAPNLADRTGRLVAGLKHAVEALLDLPLGDGIENWERQRKISKLRAQPLTIHNEMMLSDEVCKGHREGHGVRIMREFEERVRASRAASFVVDGWREGA